MFAALAAKNVAHFAAHPAVHSALIVAYGVSAGYVLSKFLPKIAGADTNP